MLEYFRETNEIEKLFCHTEPSSRVNSSSPSATYMYMRQRIRSPLVQIMACRLFGTKPLPKPVLGYCQLYPYQQTSLNFNQKIKLFIHKNASENIICEMAAILSTKRWVNSPGPGDTYMIQVIIDSGNGLSPVWNHAITGTSDALLSIGHSQTNFSKIYIKIQKFSIKKICLKMLSTKPNKVWCYQILDIADIQNLWRMLTLNGE